MLINSITYLLTYLLSAFHWNTQFIETSPTVVVVLVTYYLLLATFQPDWRVRCNKQTDVFLFARCCYVSKNLRFSLISIIKGFGVSEAGQGGHTVAAHGGQQQSQGPRPCSKEGARGK